MKRPKLYSPLVAAAIFGGACDGDTSRQSTTQDTLVAPDTNVHDALEGDAIAVAPSLLAFGPPRRYTNYPEPIINQVASRDGHNLLVATNQGLYRATAPDFAFTFDAAFARATTSRAVSSVVMLDDGGIMVLLSNNTIFASPDDGETWIDATPLAVRSMEDWEGGLGKLVTDGRRTIVIPAERPPMLAETLGGPWVALSALGHAIDEVSELRVTELAFVDDETLICSSMDYKTVGAHTIKLVDAIQPGAIWSRAEGLDEWGYTSFVFNGAVGLTANDFKIFMRGVDGKWFPTLTVESDGAQATTPGLSLVAFKDVFVAAGDDGVRRSTTGVEWEKTADVRLGSTLVAAGDSLLGVDGTLQRSADSGATWSGYPSGVATPRAVFADGADVYAYHGLALYAQRGGEAPEPLPAALLSLDLPVMIGDTTWISKSSDRKVYRLSPGDEAFAPVEADWGAAGHADDPKRLFAAGGELFAGFRDPTGFTRTCGLRRYDAEIGAWTVADLGLPAVGDCAAALESLSGADGALYAGTATGATYRSDDKGASWALLHDKAFAEVASCGGATVARDAAGALYTSVDGGTSFDAFAVPGVAGASALVTLDGQCVFGVNALDGAPTIHASVDGQTFQPIADGFAEPVVALAAGDGVLAVNTASQGLVRFDVEAP